MPQLRLSSKRGVVRCIVGYTGGQQPNPTYKSILDATEALLIEFDPKLVSYEDLLLDWTRMHKSTSGKCKRQYRSAVWYLNEEQQEMAEQVVEQTQAAYKKRCDEFVTSIEPATTFYRAEEYHQDYMKKKMGMMMNMNGAAGC